MDDEADLDELDRLLAEWAAARESDSPPLNQPRESDSPPLNPADDPPQNGQHGIPNPADSNDVQRPSTSGHNDASKRARYDDDDGQRSEEPDVDNSFHVTERNGLFNREFNVRETMYVIRLNSDFIDNSWGSHLRVLGNALRNVLDRATAGLDGDDLVRVFIMQDGLQTPIIMNLTPVNDVTVETVLALIEKVLQSNEALEFHKTFRIHVATVKIPRGGGRICRFLNITNQLLDKTSVVTISNNDTLCAARSIVVCIAKIQNDPRYPYIRRSDRPLQGDLARDLCRRSGVDERTLSSLADIERFERCLGLRVVVISATKFNGVTYRGNPQLPLEPTVFLYHNGEHYDAIVNVTGFFGLGYFCYKCLIPFHNYDNHRCGYTCQMCRRVDCPETRKRMCNRCFRVCNNVECFELHKSSRKSPFSNVQSLCDKYWRCVKCDKTISRKRRIKHLCGEKFCQACNVYFLYESHKCYITAGKTAKPKSVLIFFDMEAVQTTGIHEVNLVIAHRTCEKCFHISDIDLNCEVCGYREFIAEGVNACDKFGDWLFDKRNSGTVCIAHNLRAYDGTFVLRYLVRKGIKPDVIYNGSKIMYLNVPGVNIKLIDSLNHFHMPLSSLPKTFGLDEQMCKNFFPYLFNTWENIDYSGPIPHIPFYDPSSMACERRVEFLKWYEEQTVAAKTFNMRSELYTYCRSDVDILRKSCLEYRRMLLELTKSEFCNGTDPFNYITGSSLAFAVFKNKLLEPNTLARVNKARLINDQYSKISICWLEWVMHRDGVHISHALNDGEVTIGPYRADGYQRIASRSHTSSDDVTGDCVMEFLGCFCHGCPDCYAPEVYNTAYCSSMGDLYAKTLRKKQYLLDRGLKYVYMWECAFRKMLKEDAELSRFVESLDLQERLDPRDAFYGGRVNATKLLCEVKHTGDEIRYVDFTSLYPYINKTGLYVIGYPEIITSNFRDISTYVGFVKCKIIPPRKLYHPVLPYRCGKKLLFPLCRTCCEKQSTETCRHSDDQRALTATYVTLEVNKAVQMGYIIAKIYEVYHFDQTRQQSDTQKGLFTEYIDTFMKIKQQSTGFPHYIQNESDKERYISDYLQHEGVSLDRDKILKNPGLRTIGKSKLCQLWGKFGQRPDLKRSVFVSDLPEFYELLFDRQKKILDVHIITDTVLMVDWVESSGFEETPTCSNVYVAAFTTASARLKLYEILEKLGDRVTYLDTDSVIYYKRASDDVEIPLGVYLGDLTSELEPGEYIVSFASGGSKNYAFMTNTGRTVCKVRGFTLNYKGSEVINFHTLQSMVKNMFTHPCRCKQTTQSCRKCLPTLTLTEERKICRDRIAMTVYNRREDRDYRLCYTKRVICEDFNTLPYGY